MSGRRTEHRQVNPLWIALLQSRHPTRRRGRLWGSEMNSKESPLGLSCTALLSNQLFSNKANSLISTCPILPLSKQF